MKKILVVDDEPEILSLIKLALEQARYEVVTCDDGKAAWDLLVSAKPDLLILDVMLPGLDGYTIQQKISQEPSTKDMPIIVLTSMEPTKTLFRKFPQVTAFMTKPFKIDELLENVAASLRGGRP